MGVKKDLYRLQTLLDQGDLHYEDLKIDLKFEWDLKTEVWLQYIEAVAQRCSVKKMFLKVPLSLSFSLLNTCKRIKSKIMRTQPSW